MEFWSRWIQPQIAGIVPAVFEAFDLSRQSRPGPVFLDEGCRMLYLTINGVHRSSEECPYDEEHCHFVKFNSLRFAVSISDGE